MNPSSYPPAGPKPLRCEPPTEPLRRGEGPQRTRSSAKWLWLWCLLVTPLLLLGLLVAGVASCFRLGADARAMRNELNKASGVEWRQQIALNTGWLTWGAVRAGLSFVRLDPAAHAALQSIGGAGVGIYHLPAGTPPPNRAAMLVTADSAMTARGWERVVGVIDGRELVAVYIPKAVSLHRLKCCVLVFDGKQMVLASVRGNPKPILDYALARPDLCNRTGWLAQR
jgi:hypothetical protein